MEVGIRMEAETPPAGKRRFVAHAYMTFVALSPTKQPKTTMGRLWLDSKPSIVPKVTPHSPAEHQRWEMAERRRQRRFSERKATAEMKAQLEQIRVLLREWSLGLRRQSIQPADVISHPALVPPIAEDEEDQIQSPTTIEASDIPTDLKSTSKRHHRRRYSTATYLVPQPEEKNLEVTYAEVVELVVCDEDHICSKCYLIVTHILRFCKLDATACKHFADHVWWSDYPVDGNVCIGQCTTLCLYLSSDS